MGFGVLTDSEQGRSVFLCTTTERPLDHEAFTGADSAEQAQDFLEWLDADPRDVEALAAKGYHAGPLGNLGAWYPALDHALSAWRKLAFDPATDEFVGHGAAL